MTELKKSLNKALFIFNFASKTTPLMKGRNEYGIYLYKSKTRKME